LSIKRGGMKMVFNHGIHRIHGMIISLVLLLLVRSSFAATWYVDAVKKANENNIRLVTGVEFCRMLLNVGIKVI
jgi:hypothetical protein